jgi:hypothetical protein
MADADERTREILERYGGLHPVTFGHCGYPGLCVRGTARSFCLGCPFLGRRPEYLDRVDFLLPNAEVGGVVAGDFGAKEPMVTHVLLD